MESGKKRRVSSKMDKRILCKFCLFSEHIWQRTKLVLNPLSRPTNSNNSFLEDRDVAGPLAFCLLLGLVLLMTGKMYMGYIFGLGLLGSFGLYMLLHLMTEHTLDTYQGCSFLFCCRLEIHLVLVSDFGVGLLFAANRVSCGSCNCA